jgi:putative two-component system response regulator
MIDAALLRRARILIVDDEAGNVAVLEDILRVNGYAEIRSVTDPCDAVAVTEEFAPDLIILDLHMPRLDGFEVMQQVQEIDKTPFLLPILVVSGDYATGTKRRALLCGARDFLARPFDAIEIALRVENLLEARLLQLQLHEQNQQLEDLICERTQELEQAQLDVKEAHMEIIVRLALAGELHDNDTGEHTQRVSITAAMIAQVMGLEPEQVELLRRAAPLHDVGKIGVADPILLKPARLNEHEFNVIKDHCRVGAQLLSGGNAELVQMAERIALAHHEHWNGSGYPLGLRGEEIPLEARILAVADVFDALTHDRPYKNAWALEAAVDEISRQSGHQFDPQVVEAFLSLPHHDLL